MNILIPIAGDSLEIESNGYIKSLYEINRKIAFQHVYESLCSISDAHFILVLRESDVKKFHFDDMMRLLIQDATILVSQGETCGSACTCLLAIDYINNDEPLLISGCDQLITHSWKKIMDSFQKQDMDGGVVCFDALHPKWSYVKLDKDGLVCEAAEKHTISRNATTGQYYFRHGSDFVSAAFKMIEKDVRINGQYYVCPCYNEMILNQARIGAYFIGQDEYFSLKDQKNMDAYGEYLKQGAQK